MSTNSTKSLGNESETATHGGGPSKFVAINMVNPTDISPDGDSVDGITDAADMVNEAAADQRDDVVKGGKRKRTSSLGDGAGLGGATDLAHGVSMDDGHGGSEATSETGKGSKAKKGRKKGGAAKKDGKARPPAKKATGAGKKGKRGGTKVKEEDSDGRNPGGLITTPPPDDDNANRSNTVDASGDEESKPKGKKAGAKGVERKVWSPAEDEVITALRAAKTPWKEIVAALNKMPSSSTTLVVDVTMAINRWKRVLKHIITWSDEEVKTLKSIYDAIVKDPFTALADRMNKELDETKFTKQGCERKIKEMMKDTKSQ
ncbi:hypothetical protein EV426DRAFT_712871 [Tirmania nivea]|nr:hypothetical protein EV426DRAFT_712871 [Tirmania nivea]